MDLLTKVMILIVASPIIIANIILLINALCNLFEWECGRDL